MYTFRSIPIFLAVVVVGFAAWKLIAAFLDINGLESDLTAIANNLATECVGNPGCEYTLVDQIEMIRVGHNHQAIELDYSTLDYNAADNLLKVQGARVVDFNIGAKSLFNFSWHFTLKVEKFL